MSKRHPEPSVDLWPRQYENVGSTHRTLIGGARLKIDKWAPVGPYPKTAVTLSGHTEDGRHIALIGYLNPLGYCVDFELRVDGAELPCRRTALYRDGGTQTFDTPIGELIIPARTMYSNHGRKPSINGISIEEDAA